MTSDIWTELLRQVGPAHHKAFAATDGDDPEWPSWYAAWLLERVPQDMKVEASKLAELLQSAADSHSAVESQEDWPVFYARYLSERLTD